MFSANLSFGSSHCTKQRKTYAGLQKNLRSAGSGQSFQQVLGSYRNKVCVCSWLESHCKVLNKRASPQTSVAQPRNNALRLCGEISIWNYVNRKCTTRIKITAVMLVTDALVFTRIISSYIITTGSTGKQLSQGFWEQGKVLKCISKEILNSSNSGGAMLHLFWPLQEKSTCFLFLLLISDQTVSKYFLIFELWIQAEAGSEHSRSKQKIRTGGCSEYFPLWPLWEQIYILKYPPFKQNLFIS